MRRVAMFCLAMAMFIYLPACGFVKSVHDQSAVPPFEPDVLRIQFVSLNGDETKAAALADMFAKELGIPVELTLRENTEKVREAMRAKEADVGLLQPYEYVEAAKAKEVDILLQPQSPVITKDEKVTSNGGKIVFEKNNGITSFHELKGKAIATTNETSAGYIIVAAELIKAGMDPKRDVTLLTMANDDEAIESVRNGKVDAAFSVETTLANGLGELVTEWRIPNNAIVVRVDMADKWKKSIRQAFITVGESVEGRKLIRSLFEHEGYVPADDSDFDGMRDAMEIAALKE